jgi:hypothetical protein
MASNSLQFHAGLPDACPLPNAEAVTKRVYRAIRKDAPVPYDFESEAERQKYANGSGPCFHWGLSTWVSMEAVTHARAIVKGFNKKCIVGFDATPTDGVIAHTPSPSQPDHHTFWKVVNVDLCPRCTVEVKGEKS